MIVNNLSQETRELLVRYISYGLYSEIKKFACIGRKKGNKNFFDELHEKGYLNGDDWVYVEEYSRRKYGGFSFFLLYKGTEAELLAELNELPNKRHKLHEKQIIRGFEKLLNRKKELLRQDATFNDLLGSKNLSWKDWNFLSRMELTDELFQKAKKKLVMIDVVEK